VNVSAQSLQSEELVMSILDIFRAQSKQFFWKQLPARQVVNGGRDALIEDDQAYFVIRLKQMYLYYSRKLWRAYHPMLYCYVQHGKREEQAIAGPGQLKDMTDSDLSRVLLLNHRLVGPIAFKGEDVVLQVGLYSVPGEDIAKTLVSSLSTIAGLIGPGVAPALEIANVVKAGVENIAGLASTRLQLGVEDTFFQNNKLREGYYVGISAPAAEVNLNQLWLADDQLKQGAIESISQPYQSHDYMIIEIEKLNNRKDWPSFPEIAEFKQQFAAALGDANLTTDEKRQRISQLWPSFTNSLNESPHLVKPDREQIALSVSTDLKDRLEAMKTGNPFETRGWGEQSLETKLPADFDFIDIADRLDFSDPNSVREATRALSQPVF
jgi:hypothetical protein